MRKKYISENGRLLINKDNFIKLLAMWNWKIKIRIIEAPPLANLENILLFF